MSQILYTNLNDRWSRFAMASLQNERLARRELESKTPAPQPARPIGSHLINRLLEPFRARDLFEAVRAILPNISLAAIRSWVSGRKRAGDLIVVQDRHACTMEGKYTVFDSTYRRARTPLKPR